MLAFDTAVVHLAAALYTEGSAPGISAKPDPGSVNKQADPIFRSPFNVADLTDDGIHCYILPHTVIVDTTWRGLRNGRGN